MAENSEQQYLLAKSKVDTVAINDAVFGSFRSEIANHSAGVDRITIVEIGAGIGTMVTRLAAADAFVGPVEYRMIDQNPSVIEEAKSYLRQELSRIGYEVAVTDDGLSAYKSRDHTGELAITFEVNDLYDLDLASSVDCVIGASVFDLLDHSRIGSWLANTLKSGGIVYAPLTFDGVTGFSPVDPVDAQVEDKYHRHMDEFRNTPGGSRSGRRLLETFDATSAPFTVLDVGGSDWIVRSTKTSSDAERIVLRYVLQTVIEAIEECADSLGQPGEWNRWKRRRLEELNRGNLTLIAHHLDILAQMYN